MSHLLLTANEVFPSIICAMFTTPSAALILLTLFIRRCTRILVCAARERHRQAWR
jgi:hypothetical protein